MFNNVLAGDIDASKYEATIGEKFFLLTDTTFSPNEVARVRLEIRNNYHTKEQVKNYGGADIAIYKVNNPIEFLKSQKNLHRISTKYNYDPKGIIASSLSYIWDSFYKKSRLAWQRILSFNARQSAIHTSESFRQKPAHSYKTQFAHYKQFREIQGFKKIDEFRYPITEAKSIDATDMKLPGSSHNFIKSSPGNVYVPLGKLDSGLYLVEAVIGDHRANTLVFISNSVLISKTSSKEIFLWTVSKDIGEPTSNSKIMVSDGLGVIKTGTTDTNGILKLEVNTPELVYFIGEDSSGGIFISENYYYDSEVYSDKLYTFTDRPLYRPGDNVSVKVIGRNFTDSHTSTWLSKRNLKAIIMDSSGTVITTKKIDIDGANAGGEFTFRLPTYSLPGGYTILLKDGLMSYTSEFRVSKYTTPHYNIDILFSKDKFKLKEKITGNIKLTYANGSPVKSAEISLVTRKQKLAIVEAETDAASLFPVNVSDIKIMSDEFGNASFELPEVNVPSRYILNVKSKDDSSFRVTATKELLVELETPTYKIKSEKLFSDINEEIKFSLERNLTILGKNEKDEITWKLIKLEDRKESTGKISDDSFSIKFEKEGTYKILILNSNGDIVGGKPHIVKGESLKTLTGTVQIELDKEDYELNDTVNAFFNFSEPIDHALITLERDKVENYSISGNDSSWIKIEKTSNKIWVAKIPVSAFFAPNITLSVLFVKNGQFVFSNKGIKLKKPKIKIEYSLDKLEFSTGEKVNLGVKTTLLGKPISTNLTISVVDEMIYVLQPEISPDISEFFYHRRRNQVKTNSNLSFHTYDASISATGRYAHSSPYSDRPLKMKERPRRENIDTALWKTNLTTDSEGNAKVEFVLPDSITRWRITSRAINNQGDVGQNIAHIKTLQSAYLKWGGVTDFRKNDEAIINIMAFNMENIKMTGQLMFKDNSQNLNLPIEINPGINFSPINFKASDTQDIEIGITGENFQDKLVKKVEVIPTNWQSVKSKDIKLIKGKNKLTLPEQAFNFKLISLNDYNNKFFKAAEDLIEYPYGCTEQTASKLIPLSIAYQILKKRNSKDPALRNILDKINIGRDRLVSQANLEGYFGWYSHMKTDSFMTAYAYLADFYAGKVLETEFTSQHWEKILEVYKNDSKDINILKNSIILWIAASVGKPVQTLVSSQIEILGKKFAQKDLISTKYFSNIVMNTFDFKEKLDLASVFLLLASKKLQQFGYPLKAPDIEKLEQIVKNSNESMKDSNSPLLNAASFSYRSKNTNVKDALKEANSILAKVKSSYSTLDRSLTLILMNEALEKYASFDLEIEIEGPVKQIQSLYGLNTWSINGANQVELNMKTESSEEIDFRLEYDTYQKDEHSLDINITRNIYLLKKNENKYISVPIEMSTGINTDQNFIDEIIIEPIGKTYSHGMLEISLPPGGFIQNELGKIEVTMVSESGAEESFFVNEESLQGTLSYRIPITALTSKLVFRHAIQFTTKGKFKLPMSRFFEMYSPDKKAYREKNEVPTWNLNVN